MRALRPGSGQARKRFGQHFLEPAWVAKLVDALDARPDETFLEIGPGRGALTVPLAARVKRLFAVEIDRDLAAALPAIVPDVDLVRADFLDVNLTDLLRDAPKPVRVVGNLPYNVASPILFKLLHEADDGRMLRDATLMLQKEVADRLVARAGSDGYGALAIQVALLADANRILSLPPGAFRPAPKVKSAVVCLRFREPAVDVGDRSMFEKLVRGVFLQRRKTVANALKPVADAIGRSATELIEQARVDPKARPEALTLADFARLARAML
ncbi:MAG TPA: 16S rRNA (adenine(1518)-N(6)/adenine(1519)-N(6))-dimethyltransferase RsmA [Vicinamibacterales bacterium]|nr:16S rRNA (adenine(1518)-N(6)/adenine(1519)-N(6))-dimethyltransferase RsmA [Vicinamibacterales bacterium]